MHAATIVLPPELLYKILLNVITNSIHSIGLSRGTQWDVNVFTTLAGVSRFFEDVVYKLIGDVFGLVEREGTRNLADDARKLMHEFHQLGEPDEWPEVASNYPNEYPSHIFDAYALLTCAICLRRTAVESSVSTFLATQEAAKTALRQVKHWPIATREISAVLYERSKQENTLIVNGIKLVRSCSLVMSLLDELLASSHSPGSSPLLNEEEAKHKELIQLLRTIEMAATNYDFTSQFVETQQPKATQLPGVTPTLCRIFSTFNDSQSSQDAPIRDMLTRWTNDCSFLIKLDHGHAVPSSSV